MTAFLCAALLSACSLVSHWRAHSLALHSEGLSYLVKDKASLGFLVCAHSHTHGRHKPDTLEQKEDRAICLASFNASILIAANSNSSCQVFGCEQSIEKKVLRTWQKCFNTSENGMLHFNV